MTPTARSTQYFKKNGFIVAKVEQRLPIPGLFVTRDAFGFGDLLVAKPCWGIALVQVTSTSNLNARETKLRSTAIYQHAVTWLRADGRIILHGWAKRGQRGKRKIWTLTEREPWTVAPRV